MAGVKEPRNKRNAMSHRLSAEFLSVCGFSVRDSELLKKHLHSRELTVLKE